MRLVTIRIPVGVVWMVIAVLTGNCLVGTVTIARVMVSWIGRD